MSDTPLLHEEKSDLVDLYKQSMGSGNYGMPTDYEAREEEDARLTLRSAIRALQHRAEKAEARVGELLVFVEEFHGNAAQRQTESESAILMRHFGSVAQDLLFRQRHIGPPTT